MQKTMVTVILLFFAVAFTGCGGAVKVKDMELQGSTGYLYLGPNNNAFVGLKNGTILEYDADLNAVLAEIPRFGKAGARNLAVSKDGSRLAVRRSDGSLDLIDVSMRKLVRNVKVPGFKIVMRTFSPDGK